MERVGTRSTALAVHRNLTLCRPERDVVAFLAAAAEDGRLVTDVETIRRTFVRLPDGRIYVPVTLRVAVPKRTHPVAREVGVALVKALAFVAVLGGLLVAAFYGLSVVAQAAVAAVHGRALMGVLGGVLLLWLVLSAKRGHACKGIHCDGCGRH